MNCYHYLVIVTSTGRDVDGANDCLCDLPNSDRAVMVPPVNKQPLFRRFFEMKKNSRRLLLVILGLMAVGALVVVVAVASVLAYRQFVRDDSVISGARLELEGLQIEADQETDAEGVVILWVEPDSPADQAGLRHGVVILSVNGRSVNNAEELKAALGEYQVGDTITLTVKDGSETQDVAVTLGDAGPYLGVNVGPGGDNLRFRGQGFGEMPHGFRMPRLPGDGSDSDEMPFEFHFDEFDFDQFEDHFGPFGDAFGMSAVVMSVTEGSPADEAGLQAGDLIVKANETTIESSQDLIDALGQLSPGDQVQLQIERGDETLTIDVTLAAHPEAQDRAFLGVFLAPEMMPRHMDELFEDQNSS